MAGYAASTIVGWAIQGPFYATAYVAKAIEFALIILLVIDFVRFEATRSRSSGASFGVSRLLDLSPPQLRG